MTWPEVRKILRDDIIKRLFGLAIAILIAAALFAYGNRSLISDHLVTAILTALLLVVCMSWIGDMLHARASYSRARYPRTRFPYEVLEKRYEYHIRDDDLLYFSRHIHLRALVDEVDTYVDKFVWTGGASALPEPGDGSRSVVLMDKAAIWTFYATELAQSLRKGEEHRFSIHWPALSDWRNSQPFVSCSSEKPTKEIEFDLRLPETALASSDLYLEEMHGIESLHPFQTRKARLTEGRYSWKQQAKLYRHYRMRWAWAGAEEVKELPAEVASIAGTGPGPHLLDLSEEANGRDKSSDVNEAEVNRGR